MPLVDRTDADRQTGRRSSMAMTAANDPFVQLKTAALVERVQDAAPADPVPEPVIVALVCSAGGLNALIRVLAGLPAGFPASVIVLQHHNPNSPNVLPRLLGRHCELPVSPAKDGDILRPGMILVVPAGKHALVTTDNTLALIASDGPPPYRPSADLLLTSLALVAPHRSIAVILSGMGSDGATGATALHKVGGIVVASDRASTEHFAMPEAAIARDDVVDHVIPLDTIAARLITLVAARRRLSATSAQAAQL